MTTALRTTVRITTDEAENVQRVKHQGSDEAAALRALTGAELGQQPNDAATLHALVVAGLKAIEEKALEIAYAREAAFMATDPECQAWRKAMRSRRNRRWCADAEGRLEPGTA